MDYFDLHCDTFVHCAKTGASPTDDSVQLSFSKRGKIDNWCQIFAIFIDDNVRGEAAWQEYRRRVSYIKSFEKEHPEMLALCSAETAVRDALEKGRCAGILAIENAAALAGKLERLPEVAQDGVRAITITWNGENEFAVGSGEGGKLKRSGIELVDAMNELCIAPDVSHLSDEGVDDVLCHTEAPIIATHSNLRSVCGHRRNLTDEHFCEIARRGGIVGLNLYKEFLKSDGDAKLSDFMRHSYKMLTLGGERSVCIGSDFDGAVMPEFCPDLAFIPSLFESFSLEFGERTAQRVFYYNAREFFAALMQ
ncbi:MAG: membrane dipeptidase [Oscillospiraceae bacterium]